MKMIMKQDFAVNGQRPELQHSSEQSKWQNVVDVAKKFRCNTLVEFGTYKGKGCEYFLQNGSFDKIISVEPVEEYFSEAKELLKNTKVELRKCKSIDFCKDFSLENYSTDKILFWIDDHPQPPFVAEASLDLKQVIDILVEKLKETNQYVFLIDDVRIWRNRKDCQDVISTLESKASLLEHKLDQITFLPEN